MYYNLRKAQRRGGVISKVTTKTGAMVRACWVLYKVVVHLVLLYGSNSWVVTGATLKLLEGFHHQADQIIDGMTSWHMTDGEWEYPLVSDALEAAGFCTIN